MGGHSHEPWHVRGEIEKNEYGVDVYTIDSSGETSLARVYDLEENVKRIVACVNACEGISTDQLERIVASGQRLAVGFGQALAAIGQSMQDKTD